MSSPSSTMPPFTTAYLGCPMIAFKSEDFPEPFGPIRRCISPPLSAKEASVTTVFLSAATVSLCIESSLMCGAYYTLNLQIMQERDKKTPPKRRCASPFQARTSETIGRLDHMESDRGFNSCMPCVIR